MGEQQVIRTPINKHLDDISIFLLPNKKRNVNKYENNIRNTFRMRRNK